MNAPIITASAHTHMGPQPPDYDGEWATHTVQVHGFESLSRGISFDSPEFLLLGNQWCLELYPDGYAEEGKVSLFLWNKSNKSTEIDLGFSVNDGNEKQVIYERSAGPQHFAPVGTINSAMIYNVATRSDVISSLVNGALVIAVHIKLATPTKSVPPPFIPENPSACKIIQGLFLNDKSADIVFEVGGVEKPKNNAMKAAKPAPVLFPAHRCIVENCSSVFADLCESHGDSTTHIQINDVSVT
jgi:hypothetical protein